VADWRERVHVIPGYGDKILRSVAVILSQERVRWVHWSEPAHPGLRWWASFPLKRWYARIVNKKALGAFGTGIKAVEDIQRWGIRVERTAVLPYSTGELDRDAKRDMDCTRFCADSQALLFLGNLCWRKSTDILLRAFSAALCRTQHSAWKLILVGNDSSNGAYLKLAKKLGIENKILFRGPVPSEKIAGVLRCSRVLVLPSRFDGWGAVLNEAASLGLALIGSDCVGASYHLIEPGLVVSG
jgi:glycosyltransferase involved in cell wall biosynthesis